MMKKFLSLVAILGMSLFLVACGQSSGNQAGNKVATVELVDGQYVFFDDSSTAGDYLALKLKVTNQYSSSIIVDPSNFPLYDSEGNKVSAEPYVFTDDKKFSYIDYQTLGKEKSVTGYLIYDIDKGDDYTLEFTALDKEEYKEQATVDLAIKSAEYTDPTDKVVAMAEEFVTSIFLEQAELVGEQSLNHSGEAVVTLLNDKKDDSKVDKSDKDTKDDKSETDDFVLGDTKKLREEFQKDFASKISSNFTEYKPSDADTRELMAAYLQANAQKAKVQYKLKSYTPNLAEVYVRPETLDWSSVDNKKMIDDFIAKNSGANFSDYNAAYQAAERYIFEELANQFEKLPLKHDNYMDNEGYPIRFVKKDGEWVLDSSESNYYFDNLSKAFRGNIDSWFLLIFLT